jgi:CTP:molybdopterin cytidylyltransferase MocA
VTRAERNDTQPWLPRAGARDPSLPWPAVVLAGERPGGNALARAHHLPAGVLVPVAGKACLARVITTLRASHNVDGGLLVGPAQEVVKDNDVLRELLAIGDFRWLEPLKGPSASALRAASALGKYPLLLTTGDHALLEAGVVDRFCAAAAASGADFVVGLVPHAVVRGRFPQSRRTVLRFSDSAWCGSNLFALRTHAGRHALELWQALEADRKRPWRMASRLGAGLLLKYLSGSLSLATALATLSARAGCRITHVAVDNARAAVDVDTSADLALAEEILSSE